MEGGGESCMQHGSVHPSMDAASPSRMDRYYLSPPLSLFCVFLSSPLVEKEEEEEECAIKLWGPWRRESGGGISQTPTLISWWWISFPLKPLIHLSPPSPTPEPTSLDYANVKTGKRYYSVRERERHWPAYQSAHIEKRGWEEKKRRGFIFKKKKMKFVFLFFFWRKFSGDFTRFLLAKRNFVRPLKRLLRA